jgi:hypothetical protein
MEIFYWLDFNYRFLQELVGETSILSFKLFQFLKLLAPIILYSKSVYLDNVWSIGYMDA